LRWVFMDVENPSILDVSDWMHPLKKIIIITIPKIIILLSIISTFIHRQFFFIFTSLIIKWFVLT